MTRPQIIRAAIRRADERIADIAPGVEQLGRWMGVTFEPVPAWRRNYRRREAVGALQAAGLVPACQGDDEC